MLSLHPQRLKLMAFKLDIRSVKDPKVADIYLYGDISSWGEVQPANISKQFAELEKKYSKCVLHINSNGGQITEGIAIHSVLCNTTMELEIIVDGIAASMAAILVQVPKAKRLMSKYSKMMMHVPSGYASGTSEDMRQYAQMMDDFEVTLREIVSDRTGLDDEAVKAKWFDGKDHWLTPQQALDAKLIDQIVDGMVKSEPKNLTEPIAIFNFYEEQISNYNHTDMDFTKLLAKLGLAATSTEDQALEFVSNVVAENANLKTEVSNLKTETVNLKAQAKQALELEIKNLLDAAITSKKITEDQRAAYNALFEKDYENTRAVLDSLKAYQPLTKVPGVDDAVEGIPEARKDWSFTDWQRQDGKGLEKLKASNPEAYKILYKNSFGSEPK